MDLDARLNALTQSLELLASMHKDGEKRMERLDEHMRQFTEKMETLGKRNLRLESLVVEIAEGTARLVNTAEAHEGRLNDHEQRLNNLGI